MDVRGLTSEGRWARLPRGLLATLRNVAVRMMVAALLLGYAGAARAQVAGTVEQGLAQLAREIAQKSKAVDRKTVGVWPFEHADRTCSVLSVYIVDELIQSLFSLPDSPLDIIERTKLEALLAERKVGQSGLSDPSTTKQLSISGVSLLTIGTITVIGERLRLNARLVATDTGKTISAAAVTIPKTADIGKLLSQPITCSTVSSGSPQPQPTGAPSESLPSSVPAPAPEFTAAGVRFVVQRASQETDRGDRSTTTLQLAVTNVTNAPVQIVWVPKPSLTDDLGKSQYVTRMVGQRICERLSGQQDRNPKDCADSGQDEAVTLSPGIASTVSMRFGGDRESDSHLTGSVLSFAGTALLLTEKGFKPISISMNRIPLQR